MITKFYSFTSISDKVTLHRHSSSELLTFHQRKLIAKNRDISATGRQTFSNLDTMRQNWSLKCREAVEKINFKASWWWTADAIGRTILHHYEISQFFYFYDDDHLEFLKLKFLTAMHYRHVLHQHAKFRKDWSYQCIFSMEMANSTDGCTYYGNTLSKLETTE